MENNTKYSRREFLKLCGVGFKALGLLFILGGDTIGQDGKEVICPESSVENMLSEGMIPKGDFLKSEYDIRARGAIGKLEVSSEEKETITAMLDNIQEQAARGMKRWESKETGARVVETEVSALKVIEAVGVGRIKNLAIDALSMDEDGDLDKEVWVLFSSASTRRVTSIKFVDNLLNRLGIFKTDGSTHTALDILMNDILRGVYKVSRSLESGKPRDLVYKAVGAPLPEGGRVTGRLVDEMEKMGAYHALGDLYAEYVEGVLSDPRARITLTGQSFGGSMAEIVSSRLEERNPDRNWFEEFTNRIGEVRKMPLLRVLADDPVVKHGATEDSKRKGEKMVEGAKNEAIKEGSTNRLPDVLAKLFYITPAYRRQLVANGIDPTEDEEQQKLKARAYEIMADDLERGPVRFSTQKIKPEKIWVYARRALYDQTDPDPIDPGAWEKYQRESGGSLAPFAHEGSVREYGSERGHAFDRFTKYAKRWLKSARILQGKE